jgi:hypothetical protein
MRPSQRPPGEAFGIAWTVTDACADPPVPVQERVYVALAGTVTDSVPDPARVPVQPPAALHEDVFCEDHVRETVPPAATCD